MLQPEWETDPLFLEQAIALFAERGDTKLLIIIATEAKKLKSGLTRFERIFSNRPIGNNVALLQFDAVLEKVGFK